VVSGGVCFGRKGKLHFIPDKARVNRKLYCKILLSRLVEDCKSFLPRGSSGHTAKLAQNWIPTNCGDFIEKDE